MTQQWTKSVAEMEVERDGGDVLNVLKRVRDRYELKSQKLAGAAVGDDAADKLLTSTFYLQAAYAVQALIEQTVRSMIAQESR